ncbi:MAG: DUF58 domain-containing protein [Gammaproteobacteria bacterium]|nr:DUF58 domain-containing protein [Gammaproteobacteria bacterium]
MSTPTNKGISIGLDELILLRAQGIGLSLGDGQGRALMAGNYRSAFRGRGMDFEEVRAYQAGDDIRRMDWRVTARSNRPHTKLFREERERPVLLCVDTGESMRFGTRVAFKSVQAIRVAALLGWSALDNHDRIGTVIFGNRDALELRPAGGKRALLHCLQQLSLASESPALPAAKASLVQTLMRLRHLARHGCLVIFISDFNGLDADAEQQFTALARHNEVLAVRIYDPLEAELPPPNHYSFSDGQQIQTLLTADETTRLRYREQFQQRNDYLATLCRHHGIRWLSMSTVEDPAITLQRYLQQLRHHGDTTVQALAS